MHNQPRDSYDRRQLFITRGQPWELILFMQLQGFFLIELLLGGDSSGVEKSPSRDSIYVVNLPAGVEAEDARILGFPSCPVPLILPFEESHKNFILWRKASRKVIPESIA